MICTRRSMGGGVLKRGDVGLDRVQMMSGVHARCRAPIGSKHKQKIERVSCRKRSIDLKLAVPHLATALNNPFILSCSLLNKLILNLHCGA